MIPQTRTSRGRQVPLPLALLTAVLVLAGGVLVRYVNAQHAGLGAADLQRFEKVFGADLPDWYGEHPFFLDWTRGDGQAFVALALDLDLDDSALRLTNPSYRFVRVGYSWLGRAVVGGSPDLVPIGLFAVNAIALAGIGALSARLTANLGPRALFLLANPAVYIGIKSDTPETLAVFLLMVALTNESRIVSALAAATLGTVRPTYMTALFARSSGGLLTAACGAAATIIIQLLARIALPASSSLTGGNITWPLVGYVEALPRMHVLDACVASLLIVGSVMATYAGITRVRRTPRLGWIATGGLVLALASKVVERAVNSLRATGALPVVLILGRQATGPASEHLNT